MNVESLTLMQSLPLGENSQHPTEVHIMQRSAGFLVTVVFLALLALLKPSIASADTILTYTGQPYIRIFDDPVVPGTYTTSMNVFVELTLASPLGANFNGLVTPLEWFISDGRFEFSSLTNSGGFSINFFRTDAQGTITQWRHEITVDTQVQDGQYHQIITRQMGGGDDIDSGYFLLRTLCGACNSDAGQADVEGRWSATTPVAEPASITLLVIGLAGIGFWVRKGRS